MAMRDLLFSSTTFLNLKHSTLLFHPKSNMVCAVYVSWKKCHSIRTVQAIYFCKKGHLRPVRKDGSMGVGKDAEGLGHALGGQNRSRNAFKNRTQIGKHFLEFDSILDSILEAKVSKNRSINWTTKTNGILDRISGARRPGRREPQSPPERTSGLSSSRKILTRLAPGRAGL